MKAQLAATAVQAAKTTKAVQGTQNAFDGLGKSIFLAAKRQAAFIGGGAAVLTFLASLRKGIASGIAFQHGQVRLAQLTGKTTRQLKGLSDTIHGLATGIGVSSKGLQGISDTLAQAGLSARETQVALKALSKTELAPTFGDINNTVEASIAIMGQFGTGVDKLEGQLGSINAVSAKFAVEASDITEAVRIAGGQFKQAGGNLNEFLALMTAVRSRTRESASTIAHGFKTIFARLQRGTTQRHLKDLLGIDLSDNGVFVGPMKAIERLHAAMANLPEGSMLAAKVGEEAAGIRQLGKFIPLVKDYKTALEALAVAESGQASLSKDVATAQESLQVQITKTGEAWQKFFHNLVDDSGFKGTISSLLALARSLASVADSLRPLIPALAAAGAIRLSRAGLGFAKGKLGFNSGGYIFGGSGSADDVPAMLAHGEYVLNARAVQRVGKTSLDRINFGGARKLRKGGYVGRTAADTDTYGLSTDLSPVLQNLIAVIRDEVAATRADIAARQAERNGTYSLAPLPSRTMGTHQTSLFLPNGRIAPHLLSSLPLTPNTFEQNALAVLSGQSSEWGPDVYGINHRATLRGLGSNMTLRMQGAHTLNWATADAPYLDRLRHSGYRSLTREQRENIIAMSGKGGLLARLRANGGMAGDLAAANQIASLQQGQAAYLASIGMPTGNSSRSLRSRFTGLGTRLTGFTPHWRTFGLGLGALALSGQSENIGQLLGGAKGKSAATGIVGGAALGGTLGSVAGPAGAAIGAVVGGLAGLVQGLNAFDKALKEKSIEDAFERIGDSAKGLASALDASHGIITADVRKHAATLAASQLHGRQAIDLANVDTAVPRLGGLRGTLNDATAGYGDVFAGFGGLSIFGGKGYSATIAERQASERRLKDISSNDAILANASGDTAAKAALRDALIRQSRGAGDFNATAEGRSYITGEATRRTALAKQRLYNAGATDVDGGKLHQQYTQEVEAEVKALENASLATKANLSAIDSFVRGSKLAAQSVNDLSDRLGDLAHNSQAADNRQALLAGAMGSSPATLHHTAFSSSLAKFGTAGFEASAGSPLLIGANRAHLALRSALPTLLNGGLDIGTSEGMGKFRAGLGKAFSKGGVSGAVQRQIFRTLEDLENNPTFAKDFSSGTNNNKLAEKLLSWADEIRSAEEGAAKQIESQASRLSEGFGKLAGLGNDILTSRHDQASIALAGHRFVAERRALRFGGDATSYLTAGQSQAPFVAHQESLTGLRGKAALDPRAILAQYASSRAGMLAAQADVERNPADASAVQRMRGFESATQRAVAALKNLSDQSKLNASMMERLNTLDKDRASRLGLAERFATATHGERAELMRNMVLAHQANKAGSLDRFSDPQKRGILDFLNSASGVRLFGGEATGEDIKRRLLENSFGGAFRQTARDRKEAEGLEAGMAGNYDRASAAQGGLTQILANQSHDFLASLEQNQRNFLQALGGTLGKPVQLPATRQMTPAEVVRQRAANQRAVASIPPGGLTVPDAPATPSLMDRLAGIKDPRQGRRLRRQGEAYVKREQRFINSKRFQRLSPEAQQRHIDQFNKAQEALTGPLNKWSDNADKLAKAMSGMPHSIELKGTHQINLVVNGAEALGKLQPVMEEMVAAQVKAYTSEKLAKVLPELGVHNLA